jgi:thiamine biosynthesis protein ThiS
MRCRWRLCERLGRGFDSIMEPSFVIANGQRVETPLPCSVEEFLVAQKLLPRSVVVEHNSEAVAPSEFSHRTLRAGDRLEIVRIVAGG